MDPRLIEAIDGLSNSVDRLAEAQKAIAADLSTLISLAEELLVAEDLGKETHSCED